MSEKSPPTDNDIGYALQKLEHKFEFLEYTLKQDAPLSNRISVLEEKFSNEINNIRRDLIEIKSEAKLKMIERLAYVTLIVGLVTTLITLKIVGSI